MPSLIPALFKNGRLRRDHRPRPDRHLPDLGQNPAEAPAKPKPGFLRILAGFDQRIRNLPDSVRLQVPRGTRIALLAFATGVIHLVANYLYYGALKKGEASETLAMMGG